MSKFTGIIIGGLAIAAAAVMMLVPGAQIFGVLTLQIARGLLMTGIGMMLQNAATLISGAGTRLQGTTITTRNPIAPWNVVYGRSIVGGTLIYINEWGDNDKYLDLVIVLACHPCDFVENLLFDKQMVQVSTAKSTWNGSVGDSFTPDQQDLDIANIGRSNNVVTCQLSANIPLLQPGDYVFVKGAGPDGYDGRWPVADIITRANSYGGVTFTYICGGRAGGSSIGKVYTQWPNYGATVHIEVLYGNHTQTFPGMLNGCNCDGSFSNPDSGTNPWTASCLLLGRTSVFLRIHYDDNYYANGLPSISFILRGKNDIYDPRTGGNAYSNNAALCIADYLANPVWGFKAAHYTEIPDPPLTAAANHCDETVPLAAGGTEPRYTLNGTFTLNMARGSILKNMLTACGGRLTYQGGQFIIWPAVWQGTSPGVAPGLGQMTGPFKWKSVSIRDLYNGVKGTYITPANNWQPGDIPPYAQDSTHGYSTGAAWDSTVSYAAGVHVVYNQIGYVSIVANTNKQPDVNPSYWAVAYEDINMIADGGERRWLDIELPFTTSASMAQRLCKIELMRRRQFEQATFRFNMAGYAMTVMDVVEITAPIINWNNKLVEVQAHRFTMEKQNVNGTDVPLLGVEIDVQSTDASDYDWSLNEELTPEGYQQAVINQVQPGDPSNLQLESDTSTTVVTPTGLADTILVTWTPPTDAYVLNGGHIEVRYMELATYTVGSVSVTNGSEIVNGNGTSWTPAMAGSDITLNGVTYEVLNVLSPTQFQLSASYTGATNAALPYSIAYGDVWVGHSSVQPSVTQVDIYPVDDGVLYLVEIRSVNAGGFPGNWIEAGPIRAEGANTPLPMRPFSQPYTYPTLHGYGFTLAQVEGDTTHGPTVQIAGTQPVNVFNALAPPQIDPYGITSPDPSGSMKLGDGVLRIFGIDAAGQRTLGSNFCSFTILNANSSVIFGVSSWDPATVGYEVFMGPDPQNLMGLGAQSGTPPSITVKVWEYDGYGPPDPRAVKFVARAKRVVHGGIAGTDVYAVTHTGGIDTVVIEIGGAPAVNEFANRFLMIVSHDGLPQTQSFDLIPIIGNDANVPCTLQVPSPAGLMVKPNDAVMITTRATAATINSIEDTGFISPFSPPNPVTGFPGGLNASTEMGLIIRVMYDPTGAAVKGDAVTVIDNTNTGYTTTPFQRVPGIGTWFIVEEPSWLTGDIVSTAMQNAVAPVTPDTTTALASVEVAGLAGYVALVELLLQDEYGNLSPESPDGFRMLYIEPQPEAPAPWGYYTIVPDTSNHATIDLGNGLNQRLVLTPTAATIPLPIFSGGTIVAGATFYLYLDQPSGGGCPLPIFTGGVNGFVSSTQDQIPQVGIPNTRTAIGFTFHGQYWSIDTVTAGGAIS